LVIENLKEIQKINSLGYLGKYQFGIETLKSVGCEAVPLLNSPELQERAFIAHINGRN
jgi:hypothetical protein